MKDRIKKIKVLAMDADGVLTDGGIVYDDDGRGLRRFDVKDGYALVLLRKAGYRIAVITARSSGALAARTNDLGIDKVYQDASPKTGAYERMLKDFGVRDDEVGYIGDDLPDLPVLRRAGWAVAVADAVPEAKQAAHYVTEHAGGHGAVREVVELLLKTTNKWEAFLASGS